MKIIAIDPGPTQSAFVIWDGTLIIATEILKNDNLLELIAEYPHKTFPMVIEQVRSYGMPVGATIFDTVFWSGRFYQAWKGPKYQMPRLEVKQHICHNSRAKDSNIRQALIDRLEPDLKPRQRPKGILKGLVRDQWAAMALAVTFLEKELKD